MDRSSVSHADATVHILDDGELSSVRELLERMGEAWLDAAALDEPVEPRDVPLLISSSRRAGACERPPLGTLRYRRRIAICDSSSRSAEALLQRTGFDWVVRAPVDEDAMRLLISHALYRGPERRRARRVPVCFTVSVKAGRRTRNATLTQLSMKGCGLRLSWPPERSQSLSLTLPRALTGGERLRLSGRVVAFDGSSEGSGDAALVFDPPDPEGRAVLKHIMTTRSAEGTRLDPRDGPGPGVTDAPRPEAEAPGEERRRAPRRAFSERVVAAAPTGSRRVLLGRDLNGDGMRVAPDPELALGEKLRLALYGEAGLAPIQLWARVARDDGAGGWFLCFEDLTERTRRRIDRLVASLPVLAPVEREGGSRTVVVSEILEAEQTRP